MESSSTSTFGDDSICVGFTFYYTDGHDGDHLHFVASDPDLPQVVVFNYTDASARWADQSCVAEAGSHPRLFKRSCIPYFRAEIIRVEDLTRAWNLGDIIPSHRLSDKLLRDAWRGAMISPNLEGRPYQMLLAQGYFDEWG